MSRTKVTASNIVECLPPDSWFRDWMGIWPTAEPPKSFILFSGMTMLGACLGRGVWFEQDPHQLYPMLNTLFVGPSGCGKSTSMFMGFKLIDHLPKIEQPLIVRGAPTPQALHQELSVNPHALLYASELANFFTREKFMLGLVPYVTELLDYRPVEKLTISHDLVRIEEPAVTVSGGSTLEWLQEQLPDTATSGGFLARFLIVSEETKGQKSPLPSRMLSKKQKIALAAKRERVFAKFSDLVDLHRGPIDLADYDAVDEYSEWYSVYTPATGHLAPFAARAGEFVLRMAMLLALSCNAHEIYAEHIRSAIALYEYCSNKLQDIIVPKSLKGKLLAQVLQAVTHVPQARQQLYAAMRNLMPAQEVDQMLASLQQDGSIHIDKEGRIYR